MGNVDADKIIIVEGLTDKRQISKIITDHVQIICTNGTFGVERFDELLDQYQLDERDVFILVDEDESGIKLRKRLGHELPHAEHMYVNSEYREVAKTPIQILASILTRKGIEVDPLILGGH